jgi:uncharacterized hydrophobic protein (TIGR00271 family)
MAYRFIYDKVSEEEVIKQIKPLVQELILTTETYKEAKLISFKEGDRILVYLSDIQLKELLPFMTESGISLAILPHPDAKQACLGFGIDFNVEKAIAHLKGHPETVETDILYCNNKAVFNKIIIGESFHLSSGRSSKSLNLFQSMKEKFKQFFFMRPFPLEIKLKDEQTINTSVSGVIIVQHKRSSLLSRLVLEASSIQDGMMHVFLLSPRSIIQLIAYGISSLWKKRHLPEFAGHIKTNKISFSSGESGIEFAKDGTLLSSKKIDLEIRKKQIKVIPGAHLDMSEDLSNSNEVYKISTLPTGEAAEGLSGQSLPILKHASTEEFKDLFQVLRDHAQLKSSFLVLMVLSTALATLGLFANSSPVVIGAMILAPLMAPIISISMATLRQDRKLAIQSITTIIAGLVLSLIFAVLITYLTPIKTPNAEILARIRPNILDLGIAVISGIAGAYAHARAEIAKTLAGVAIAVALVPPLAVAGIGLGWADWTIFSGSALLLITNFGGMVLAASITFMLLGFSPLKLASRGLIISAITVIILSIPLIFSFNRMLDEHRLIQQLDGWTVEQVVVSDVMVKSLSPLSLSVKVVSSKPLETETLDAIKLEIEEKLQKEVSLEIITVISR